jgi:phosphoribosylformylglycinamidine cyclo-ligase
LLDQEEYDVAGAGTGVVEADALLGAERVRSGDIAIAMGSSGLHSNGYSLARHVLFTVAGWDVDRDVADLGRTLGEELLEPTRIYALDCLDLARADDVEVHAISHVTGGGLAANLARVLPTELHLDLDRSTWTPQPIFGLIGDRGHVDRGELERTLNMGVGMVALVDPTSANAALARLQARGVPAWVAGQVRDRHAGETGDAAAKGGGGGSASLVGDYA